MSLTPETALSTFTKVNVNSKRQEAAYNPWNSDLNIAPHAVAD
jgi:hypothetical protein